METKQVNWKIVLPFLVVWVATVVCMSVYFAHFFGDYSIYVFSVLSLLGTLAGAIVVTLGNGKITNRHLLILLGIAFISFLFAYALPSGRELIKVFILPALDSLRY
jgi:hypothetical protein